MLGVREAAPRRRRDRELTPTLGLREEAVGGPAQLAKPSVDGDELGLGRLHTERGKRRDEQTPAAGEVRRHSTIWSARSSTDRGIVSPSAFAVRMLMTSSNFVGCSMGRSPGFAPLRILST